MYLQEVAGLKPELKVPCSASSPIIDPHLSPDGTMLAYVMDDELYIQSLLHGVSKLVTPGAKRNSKVRIISNFLFPLDVPSS